MSSRKNNIISSVVARLPILSATNQFSRPAALLFIATIVANFFNYLYQIFMGRTLGPENFGIFGSLFGIFYFIALVGGTIQSAVVKFISMLKAQDKDWAISWLINRFSGVMALLALLVFMLFVAGSGIIASFLGAVSPLAVVILGAVVFFALLMPVALGFLQGVGNFTLLGGLGLVVPSFLRLSLGLLLVLLGLGLYGALGAIALSLAVPVLAILLPLRFHSMRSRAEAMVTAPEYRFFVPALFVAFYIGMPASVDVMIVTHFFPAPESGAYNAAATLGKVVIFLPLAVSLVMFPQVSHSYERGLETRTSLAKALLVVALLSGAVALAYLFLGDFIIRFLFGEAYRGAHLLLRWYGLAMLLFSLTSVLMQYGLAIRNYAYTATGLLWTVAEVIAMSFMAHSTMAIIGVLLLGNLFFFSFSFISIVWLRWGSRQLKAIPSSPV